MTVPASTLLSFRATWPSGAVDRHELPVDTAIGYAADLRALGVSICWHPLPPPEPTRPPRIERKAGRRAEREQQRQLADMGVA